ncbi:tctex1 domain-containing protein 1 isoform X1 [Sebastes umbrosus]|uniref:tctex1 domain-containing protein 1 isoform X1 n=1 Tax=Sebastes umbrosus TaxID=72105 RepID=UPI00189EA50A|nr:tctex1 domain-containing protein 1 isoform X1 [Sebastes umbrosus]
MSDLHLLKDKSQRSERRTSTLSEGSHGVRGIETTGRTRDSISIDLLKDKSQRIERKQSKVPSEGSHGVRGIETTGRTRDSISADLLKDKFQRKERRSSKMPSDGSHGVRGKETTGRTRDSVSTGMYMDELAHHDDNARMAITMENTYQMEPYKRIPVPAVTDILKDVLTNYLQEEKYEVEWSQQMTKTICEVIRARVKDLMIPRYKIVVLVHIGQLTGQSMQISSRCLWDASNDTSATYSFKNSSLYGVATVYAVYFE